MTIKPIYKEAETATMTQQQSHMKAAHKNMAHVVEPFFLICYLALFISSISVSTGYGLSLPCFIFLQEHT